MPSKKLKKTVDEERVVVPMNYNPRFPNQAKILRKHHKALLIKNKPLKEIFPKPPMAGLRQHKNLKRLLCKPRLDPKPSERPSRVSRHTPSWKPCKGNTSSCPICPYTAKPTSEVVSDVSDEHTINNWEYSYHIRDDIDCGAQGSNLS